MALALSVLFSFDEHVIGRLSFPPKLVTVLGVVQVFAIVTGTALTGTFLKMEDVVWERTYASALAQFVRFHGMLFLSLPLIWASWVVLRSRGENRVIDLDGEESLVGFVLTTAIILLFAFTSIHSVAMATMQHGPRMIMSGG